MIRLAIICLTVIVCAAPASAGVVIKNGNYYVSYTDVIVPGSDFKLIRIYNSLSNQTFSFGNRWSSDLDTVLRVNANGSIKVIDNGGGRETTYFRAKDGASFVAKDDPRRKVIREPSSFLRLSGHRRQRFDLKGRLLENVSADGRGFSLIRSEKGHILKLIDAKGKTIDFRTTPNGLILEATHKGRGASYEYDRKGRLIAVTYGPKTRYRYDYDARGLQTRIAYPNGTTREIRYNKEGLAKSVREPNGNKIEYYYGENDIKNPEIYRNYYRKILSYRKIDGMDKLIGNNSYRYISKKDNNGVIWTYGITKTENGTKTETRYHRCGAPAFKRRGGRETTFEVDGKCRLVKKDNKRRTLRVQYDAKTGKWSHVSTLYKTGRSKGRKRDYLYRYDEEGNLIYAQRTGGARTQSVKLTYRNKLIATMTPGRGDVLTMTYNEFRKPVVIKMAGVGEITVDYDQKGVVKATRSKDGNHKLALSITQAYQSLLALTRPLGLDFNM
ncbi:MAG: DUF6531 domain-containing protein [Methyloligellaceae bacterium]